MTRLLRVTNGNFIKFHRAGCNPISYKKDPESWTEVIEESDIYDPLSFSLEEFVDFIVTRSMRLAEDRGKVPPIILRSDFELIPD